MLLKKIGDNHEDFDGNNPSDKDMDLYNNGVGRELALDPRFKDMSAEDLALFALTNGLLQREQLPATVKCH